MKIFNLSEVLKRRDIFISKNQIILYNLAPIKLDNEIIIGESNYFIEGIGFNENGEINRLTIQKEPRSIVKDFYDDLIRDCHFKDKEEKNKYILSLFDEFIK